MLKTTPKFIFYGSQSNVSVYEGDREFNTSNSIPLMIALSNSTTLVHAVYTPRVEAIGLLSMLKTNSKL